MDLQASVAHTRPMDLFSYIVQAVIVIGSMTGILIVLYVILGRTAAAAAKKMPEEHDLTPLHTQDCGGKFDAEEYNWPWVKLRIYEEFLVISYREPFRIFYEQIDRVEVRKVGMQETMTLHHHKPRTPKLILLKATSMNLTAKAIEQRLAEKH